MVGAKRLELLHLAALEPKSSASTNSATPPDGANHSKPATPCLALNLSDVQTLLKQSRSHGFRLFAFFKKHDMLSGQIKWVKQMQFYRTVMAKITVAMFNASIGF